MIEAKRYKEVRSQCSSSIPMYHTSYRWPDATVKILISACRGFCTSFVPASFGLNKDETLSAGQLRPSPEQSSSSLPRSQVSKQPLALLLRDDKLRQDVRLLHARPSLHAREERQALEARQRDLAPRLRHARARPALVPDALHLVDVAPAPLADLQPVHAWLRLELQVPEVQHDLRVVDGRAVARRQLQLQPARRLVREDLAGVAFDDDVVKIKDRFDTALAFVVAECGELNVVKVV